MSVWDKTTPAGSDNVSAGDDRIRELKEALEDALSDSGVFPGSAQDTAPIYRPRVTKDTTGNRPAAADGGLYFNTTTGTFQRSTGSAWESVGPYSQDDELLTWGTENDSSFRIDANTGDAKLILRVNNADAQAWDIYNDNTDDDLTFDFNSNNILNVDSSASDVPITITADDPAKTLSAQANALYHCNMIKAWGHLDFSGAGPSVALTDGFNVTSVAVSTSTCTVTLGTNMANETYVAIANSSNAGTSRTLRCHTYVAGSFKIENYITSSGSAATFANGDACEFIVVGRQT